VGEQPQGGVGGLGAGVGQPMFAGGQDQANRLRLIVAASLTNGSRRHRCACRVPEVGTRGRSAMISVLGQSIMITRRDHRRVAPAVEPDLPADAWMVLLMARTAATTNVEQPTLRQEATVRRRTKATPGPDCSCRCSCTGPGPLGPLRAQWDR